MSLHTYSLYMEVYELRLWHFEVYTYIARK